MYLHKTCAACPLMPSGSAIWKYILKGARAATRQFAPKPWLLRAALEGGIWIAYLLAIALTTVLQSFGVAWQCTSTADDQRDQRLQAMSRRRRRLALQKGVDPGALPVNISSTTAKWSMADLGALLISGMLDFCAPLAKTMAVLTEHTIDLLLDYLAVYAAFECILIILAALIAFITCSYLCIKGGATDTVQILRFCSKAVQAQRRKWQGHNVLSSAAWCHATTHLFALAALTHQICVDSGCSRTLIVDESLFATLNRNAAPVKVFGFDGSSVSSKGVGTVKFTVKDETGQDCEIVIEDCLYMPDLKNSLISESQLLNGGYVSCKGPRW